MSGLAYRLAARDLGRTGRGLWLLVTCLFLGAAALGGIGSLSTSIVAALADQGRQALGGDLEMHVSQRRATVAEQAAFAARGPISETLRLRGMLGAGGATALVDLKAVDARWPLIGQLQLAPGALAPRPSGLEAAIAPALADRLRVRVGDAVTLGAARLRVIGLIADEPDRLGEGFRLGLPVIVPLAALDAAGLIQPGSLYDARYRMLLGAGHAAPTGAALARGFPSAGWSVRTADDATRSLRRGIDQLGQFLLLAGLAALAIACLGVASGVSARLAAKTGTIATLKVLGARSDTIAAMLAAELGIAALIGIGAGLMLGAAVPALVAGLAGDALPVPPRIALYPQPLGVAGALALIAATVAALPALARARNVPAATLLRGRLATSPRPSIRVLAAMAMLAIAGAAIAILGASDRMLAAGFLAGAVVLIGLLALIGRAIRWGVARLPRPRRPLLRLALANLHRPGAPTDRLVVALGLGILAVRGARRGQCGLAAELASAAPPRRRASSRSTFSRRTRRDSASRSGGRRRVRGSRRCPRCAAPWSRLAGGASPT